MLPKRSVSFFLAALAAGLLSDSSYGQLALSVDRISGAVQLTNSPIFSSDPVSFDAYLIRSDAGALDPAGWFSLNNQGVSDWFQAGTPSEFILAEAQLVGSTELAVGQSLSLGNAYNSFVGIEDLAFEYTTVGGLVSAGPVLYVGDPFPPALLGDYNFDGIVSHADYSVLGDTFGSTGFPAADGNADGTVDLADYAIYKANFGAAVAAAASAGSLAFPPGSLPFLVSPSTTAEGNTQWDISFSGVEGSLAGHLNISTNGAQVLSAIGGESFQDDSAAPVGVPGFPAAGGISEGIVINGASVYAALGSTLGAPSPGPNRHFLTLVTAGSQSVTLSIDGEYGYQGANFSLSGSAAFGPGSSPSDPILPDATNPGEFVFVGVPSGAWVDPPLVDSFAYVMDSASLFTSILDFPPGFAQPFEVIAEGSSLGSFTPGQSVDFVALLGHGVGQFLVSGIAPLVDAEDPAGFPLKLAFSTPTASFRMLAVPEPATFWLVGMAWPMLSVRSRSQGCDSRSERSRSRI